MDSLIGRVAERYRLLARIGQGGMSVVYRAQREGSAEDFAVKVLSPLAAETGQFARRFQREAAVLTRLRHPRIVPVIDFGEVDGRPFLVMPLVAGGSLADRLALGPLDPRLGGRLLDQITGGLSYAHGQGVVHRDIKPSNILLDSHGDAQLSDFGLALIHDASVSLTGSALIGTPSYMSPEQARGATVDARTDQYSLGIVLYELTTGRLPFVADTPMAVVVKHMQEPLPLPRSVNSSVPLAIERVILKATAKDPGDRFPNVLAMNQAFQEALAHTLRPSGTAPPLIPVPPSALATMPLGRPAGGEPGGRTRRRVGFAAALALLAALLCLAGGAAAFRMLGGRGEGLSASALEGRLPGSDPGLEVTIASLSTALAIQETEGPGDAGLLASLQGSLTALPSRPGGSKDLATASPIPGAFGSPTEALVSLLGIAASGTPSPSVPPTTARTPTRTPTRTPQASATRTRTPVASVVPVGSASPTSAAPAASPSTTVTATSIVPSSSPPPTATSVPPTATSIVPSSSPPPTATSVPPTATARPPTATAVPPTSTRTSEPPPPSDLCGNVDLTNPEFGPSTLQIDVHNRSAQRVQITALRLAWPPELDRLDRIRFKSRTIWDRGDSHPPTSIDPGEWKWGVSRRVDPGAQETLTFIFTGGSSSEEYDLEITLDGVCAISW